MKKAMRLVRIMSSAFAGSAGTLLGLYLASDEEIYIKPMIIMCLLSFLLTIVTVTYKVNRDMRKAGV